MKTTYWITNQFSSFLFKLIPIYDLIHVINLLIPIGGRNENEMDSRYIILVSMWLTIQHHRILDYINEIDGIDANTDRARIKQS